MSEEEEERGQCVGCRAAIIGEEDPVMCGGCFTAEFCPGCGRDGAARAAGAAAGGRNQPAAWCPRCIRCADCTGRAHCMRSHGGGSAQRIHGVCEGCLDDDEWMCGACAECSGCCECARAPPAVCTECNLRPAPAYAMDAGLALCDECLQRPRDAAEAGARGPGHE
jgi:hypothetical protein